MGCVTPWGRASSAQLWYQLIKDDGEIWAAEYSKSCVDDVIARNVVPRLKTMVGDQADPAVVNSWLEKSGGNFDVIIDDGGHTNLQIITTFNILWYKALAPNGLYFIEDIHVGRMYPGTPIVDIIKSWIGQLVGVDTLSPVHPLPPRVKWIFCQADACVLMKCGNSPHDRDNCRSL